MPLNTKPIPKSVLIFGASAHIGRPLAQFLNREAPSVKLRLATSNPSKTESLYKSFPAAEVVIASYYDADSLKAAVDGIEGVFVVSPPGTNEEKAMSNLVTALKASGSAIHILKLLGMQPEANIRRFPKAILQNELSLPMQCIRAKQILDESDLPVTYLNSGATFMDNFFWMKRALKEEHKLIWPERLIPFIDPRDIAEVAGRLLLSNNQRHISQFHTMNNGNDLLRFSDVAEIMTEVWGVKITYESSREAFLKEYGQRLGPVAQRLLDFFDYEEQNEVVWAPNKFVELMIGRKPTTVREWLLEHKDALLN